MINIKEKADHAYYTGSVIVDEKYADDVMKELEKYNETFYDDIRMNGCVIIERG